MKFADHLSKETIRKFNQLRKAERNKKESKPKKNKIYGHRANFAIIDEMVEYPAQSQKKEKLSQRDLKELMGTRRDIYKRHNGAWRRK